VPEVNSPLDDAVAAAKNVPDLIAKAKAVDPDAAAALEGKALITSKTPIGVLATAAISYLAVKYGLGWSQEVDELVAGVAILAASYVMRYVSPARITGLFRKPSP
jgi:hypothetical protein